MNKDTWALFAVVLVTTVTSVTGLIGIIWAVNRFGDQDERLCIQQHGEWIDQNRDWDGSYFYCKF